MSFLSAVTNSLSRAEQLKNAWNSLSYDILTQHNVMSPPLTPESVTLQNRVSPSARQISSVDIADGVLSKRDSTLNIPANFHKVTVKELYPSGEHFTDYIQLRDISNKEESCACCSVPVSSMILNGSHSTWSKNSKEHCIQNRHVFPNNTTSTERLVNHFFETKRPVYPFNISSSNSNNTNNHNNNNDSSSSKTNISSKQNGRLTPLKRKLSDPDDIVNHKKNKKGNDDIACQVHGILSLPGCREPRYNITVGELERRVNQPECLTKVDMISYVRLAKNSARSLLEKYEIKTNQHNQRSEHTVLSKMCESEAQVLAKGIREINYRYFPGNWFARKSVQEITKNTSSLRQQHEALSERLKEDEITRCVLLDIYFGLEKRKDDEQMRIFNGISHSFGVPNIQNHILFLLSYIEEELRVLRNL